MAKWMDQHFKEAAKPEELKPKGTISGAAATVALLLLATAVVGSVFAAIYLSREPPEVVEARAPAQQRAPRPAVVKPAPPPAAPVVPPIDPPKGLATLIERVVEVRRDRASHLRWLDACEQQGLVGKAQRAIADLKSDDGKWDAQTRLNNLLADIKNHQQEVARLDDLCDGRERRLVSACREAGYPVPDVENPSTTSPQSEAREKRRPKLAW